MSRRRIALIALAAVLAVTAVAVPASASANLYCVNKPLCLGGTTVANPQAALTLAQLHLGADTVLIGPQATPYQGPFSYTGSEPVTIVGSGTGSGGTTLAAPAGVLPTLSLKDPGSTVSSLRIEVVTGPGVGLELEGTATGVRVQEDVDDDEIGPALGVFLAGGASFEQGSVAMEGGQGSPRPTRPSTRSSATARFARRRATGSRPAARSASPARPWSAPARASRSAASTASPTSATRSSGPPMTWRCGRPTAARSPPGI